MDISPAKLVTAMPYPRTPFVGREDELAALDEWLRPGSAALLVLTGPGGVGKTRLALQATLAAASRFSDGAAFVDLTSVDRPHLLMVAIHQDLGLRDDGRATVDQVRAYLCDREFLLVLDGCDKVARSAGVLSDLLSTCPRLTLLATSRIRLRLSAERVFQVDPLPLPDTKDARSIEALETFPAIYLFKQRACAVSPDFELTPANIAAIDDVCRRLDGLPLAIEIAATRLNVLSPFSLRARLERRLPLLTGGPRDLPDRQQTMRDTIAWSYDLLDDASRACFRQLSVFIGGFTMQAAEAVIELVELSPFEAVSVLVDESLVRRQEPPGGDVRFSILDTIREYAAEELAAKGEEQATRQRHAEYFLGIAEAARLAPFLRDGVSLFARLQAEQANLRGSLEWLASNDAIGLVRMTGSLGWFWSIFGPFADGKMWLERALEGSSEGSGSARCSALCALGAMWFCLYDRSRALPICEQAVDCFRDVSDHVGLAIALRLCAIIEFESDNRSRSKMRLKESLELAVRHGSEEWAPFLEGIVLCDLGKHALIDGDIDLAEQYHQTSFGRMEDASRGWNVPPMMACEPLFGLAEVFRARRQYADAVRWYQESLRHAALHGFLWVIVSAFAGIAGSLAAAGKWEDAARYFGISEAISDSNGVSFHADAMDRQRAFGLPEPWMKADEPLMRYSELRNYIRDIQRFETPPIPDTSAAARYWAAGRLISATDAIAIALALHMERDSHKASNATLFDLTPREMDVLHLLVEGQSDREIASALFISSRTAEKHVHAILSKFSVTSRTAAATLAVRRGL